MASRPVRSRTSTIDIYIRLAQYPILSDRIRERMREELFRRGVISREAFEAEVRERAIESQRREGIHNPYSSEPAPVWQQRKERIRDYHTDFYFGYNLPYKLLEQIIEEVLEQQPRPRLGRNLAFNPEVAPWSLLFEQGELYERLPPIEQEAVVHHLEEIKVVLIKGMISDQLPYIGIAKKIFTVADLRHIHERRIGEGKIGGKAAGMLLAWKILQRYPPPDEQVTTAARVTIPESFFVGTDMLYEFHRLNNLEQYMNQKYRQADEIRADYPRILAAHLSGVFPSQMVEQLELVLAQLGKQPMIVRSSSLLEDNFGYAFAGKYQSYFCPNQGTHDENLHALLDAIRSIYASALNPDALLYRERQGLLDYDERMAVLIQPVHGQRHGRYYFPALAGVGFSNNPFRWHPKIRREEGFLRLVWGLGTRAVDRVSDDYPRMISLSHPRMRPESSASAIRRYSQHYVDVIDLEANQMVTLPIQKVLDVEYPYLRFIASDYREDYVQELVSTGNLDNCQSLVLTFDALVRDSEFVGLMQHALRQLEEVYQNPVDIEFAVEIAPGKQPSYRLVLLQCRPLSVRDPGEAVTIPAELEEEALLFRTTGLVPDGKVEAIRYVIVVDPRRYGDIEKQSTRLELGRAIGRLNKLLDGERFVLLGPGRWGSANIDLGVRVSYADIFNTKVLIEMAVAHGDATPELSYGTHFFQDLVEGGIHSLPLHLHNLDSFFNWSFFASAPNALGSLSPADQALAPYLKVIDLAQLHPPQQLVILMDGEHDLAVGLLGPGASAAPEEAQLSTF